MNKTIINQNKGQIRKRNESRNMEHETISNSKKIYKTPAVVLEVVQIVNQKKAYHRLRNMGIEKKNAFEFDINVNFLLSLECSSVHQEKIWFHSKKKPMIFIFF